MRLLVWSLLFSLALTGCAGLRLGAGKGRWRRVETAHFTLYTDLPGERAEAQAIELERLLAALEQTGWEAKGTLPLKLNVVMFNRHGEFERYGKGEIGGYVDHELLFEPWMVMPETRRSDQNVAAHELTHYIAYQAMQNQPRWFAEGLASYFESARFTAPGRLRVGSVARQRFEALRVLGVTRPSDLFLGAQPASQAKFYGSAWLLVHFLMTEHPDAFVEYQRRLARGYHHDRAWNEAFPTLPPAKLDEAVAEYAIRGEYATFDMEVSAPEVQARTHTLTPADEHALQAIVSLSCPRCSERQRAGARESVALARRLDPTQLQAGALDILWLSKHDAQAALAGAHALTESHPEHWLSWVTLAIVASDTQVQLSPEAGQALASRVLELAPRQAYAWLSAALQYARANRREQALRATLQAQQLQPSNHKLLAACMALFVGLADCARASKTLELLESSGHDSLGQAALLELRERFANCQQATDPAPPALTSSGAPEHTGAAR